MASENPLQEGEEEYPPMKLTEEMQYFIYESARWGKILSVFGLVFSVFMFLLALSIGPMFDVLVKANPAMSQMPGGAKGLGILYAVFSLVIFIPSLLLFQYSAKAKDGISYNSEQQVTEAMGKLLSYFKFWGITVLVVVAIYAIGLFESVFSGK